jgi:hypothetical protein
MNFSIDPNEILSIEAIHRDYLKRLLDILRVTKSIKGVTAYWTLEFDVNNKNQFGKYCTQFYNLLRNPNSYMCVDLHQPTNIVQITKAVNNHANFFMFILEGKGDIYKEIYNRLLHSKLIVFEGEEFDYVLVGSHNQTGPATKGMNEEFSLLLKIDPQSVTKRNIISYLEFIRSLCVKLPSGRIERWMLELVQKKGKMDGIQNMNYIECTVLNESTFHSIKIGTLIHLISFSKIDPSQLSKINDNFCLSIQTKDGKSRKYLLVKVDKSSNVDERIKKYSTGQSFDNRHYLYHGLTKNHSQVTPSVIFPKKNLDSNYFRENKFNLELQVTKEIKTIRKSGDESPFIETWVDCEKDNKEFERFLLQFENENSLENEEIESIYKSIRVIDIDLLNRIFNSENEKLFKETEEQLVIERLGESIPIYSVNDNYIKMFKDLDKFISQNKSKQGRPTQNTVLKEFERLYQIYESTEDSIMSINENKLKKINVKHTFINRGIALINK